MLMGMCVFYQLNFIEQRSCFLSFSKVQILVPVASYSYFYFPSIVKLFSQISEFTKEEFAAAKVDPIYQFSKPVTV